jgi:hypothetical protein
VQRSAPLSSTVALVSVRDDQSNGPETHPLCVDVIMFIDLTTFSLDSDG